MNPALCSSGFLGFLGLGTFGELSPSLKSRNLHRPKIPKNPKILNASRIRWQQDLTYRSSCGVVSRIYMDSRVPYSCMPFAAYACLGTTHTHTPLHVRMFS